MDEELIRGRLSGMLRAARAGKLVAMGACLVLGPLVLFISFWICYGVGWFISFSFFRIAPHGLLLLIAGAFMTLVVIAGASQKRDTIDPVEKQLQLAEDMSVTLSPYSRYGVSYQTNPVTAGAFEVRSLARVINYVLCGGVFLIRVSLDRWREYRRLQQVDAAGCGRVVGFLYAAPGRRPFSEIVESLPGLNPVKVFDDLRYIEGVLFLSAEPPGLTLSPDLRSDLDRHRVTRG